MVWEAVKLAEEMVSGAEEAVLDMDMGGVSRQQYIILPERIHFDISLSYISFSVY